MGFTIPNKSDALHEHQAQVDKVDLDIIVAGFALTGVFTGCAVTAQGTPDMTVAVAAGAVSVAGTVVGVTAGNVTITAAHASNPRFDLVVVSNAGVKSVVAGTAAASPVFPAIPANSVVLAAVYVPANDTAIASNQITDKRVELRTKGRLLDTAKGDAAASYATTSTSFVDIDATDLAVTFIAPPSGAVLVRLTGVVERDTSNNYCYWNLRDAGGNVSGTDRSVVYYSGQMESASVVIELTGLTPGTEYTYKWGWKVTTSGQLFLTNTATHGIPSMEVWELA